MIVSDKKIKEKKGQLTIEGLMETIVSQQETQDKNIEKSLETISNSLKILKGLI